MKTLNMLIAGMLFAATAMSASAAEDGSVPTITVTGKRDTAMAAAKHVPPQADIEITVLMPTDMPETEIDYHLAPIGVSPASVVE